tara:strand:- start:3 stop:1232 length:1230 start_codon:yes stop_codon:yes gene_type:complete
MKNILIILLFVPLFSFAQGWEQIYSIQGAGNSIQQTNDGGYIITGISSADIYLLKVDMNGNFEWSNSFSESFNNNGFSVKQTNDGGYIIAGSKDDISGNPNMWIIKTDVSGNVQWDTSYSGTPCSIAQTTDGGFILGGTRYYTSGPSAGHSKMSLRKLDSSGGLTWSRIFGTASNVDYYALDIQQTSDNGFVIVGGRYGSNDGYALMYKTDNLGIEEWSASHQFNNNYSVWNGVKQTTDGGFVLVGEEDNKIHFSKVNNIGTSFIFLNNSYPTENGFCNSGTSVDLTNDGGYVVCGNYCPGIFLLKTDNLGNQEWFKNIGLASAYSRLVQQVSDGGFVIVGSSSQSGSVYLIKTNSQGNVTSVLNLPISTERKILKEINFLGKNIKSKTNTPFIEIYDDGTVEKRITID